MKAAALGWREQAGRFASGHVPLFQGIVRIHIGNRGQKRLGIGVLRAVQELFHRRLLHDATRVHHEDAVRVMANRGKVVGNKGQGQTPLLLDIAQQVEDLHAYRGVQHGDGFVGDQHGRLQEQGPGNDHPLLLATAQHVRKLGQDLVHLGQPHFLKHLANALLPGIAVLHAVDDERL
jgi:hypothetical protein